MHNKCTDLVYNTQWSLALSHYQNIKYLILESYSMVPLKWNTKFDLDNLIE